MKKRTNIEKGKLVVISQGEYSDYCVLGVFIAQQKFNPDDLREEYLQIHPKHKEPYQFNERMFVEFIVSKKLVKEIKFDEFHLGGYGEGNFVWATDL